MGAQAAPSGDSVETLAAQLAATITGAGLASASSGRIFALLMTSGEPLSQAEIKARLGVSEGSVSEGTRSLEAEGLIERVQYPKVRSSYFRIHPQAWANCAEHTLRFVNEMSLVAQELLDALEGTPVDQQVRQMHSYYQQLAEKLPPLLRPQPPGDASA